MAKWLSSFDLAGAAGISERKARAPLARAARDPNYLWRGVRLAVHVHHGRGGRSGEQYRVRADSLPFDLQRRWRELSGPVEPALKVDDATMVTCQWRHALIRPALAAPERSPERAAIVKDIAGREHVTPKGRRERVGERTLQRWIDAFEQPAPHGGFAGLMRKKRKGHGEAAVIVTRAWDRAVPFDDEVKHRVAHELRQYVRELRQLSRRPLDLARVAGLLGRYGRAAGPEVRGLGAPAGPR